MLSNPRIMSWLRLDLMGTAQAYLDRTSITVNKYLFPLFHRLSFLHVHQIHLPLFVSVKDQRGSGGKPRLSGFVERITQHRLENPLRLRGFQYLGFGKGLDPTQGSGFLGIFVSAWQRHDNTDPTSFPFSYFNSFFHTPT